jgi:hypothetical protein
MLPSWDENPCQCFKEEKKPGKTPAGKALPYAPEAEKDKARSSN